eukprot:1157429-Pelagomonas_calceolata.AAC.1
MSKGCDAASAESRGTIRTRERMLIFPVPFQIEHGKRKRTSTHGCEHVGNMTACRRSLEPGNQAAAGLIVVGRHTATTVTWGFNTTGNSGVRTGAEARERMHPWGTWVGNAMHSEMDEPMGDGLAPMARAGAKLASIGSNASSTNECQD